MAAARPVGDMNRKPENAYFSHGLLGSFAGGGKRDLTPAQREAARGVGATPVKAAGEHAEITVMNAAVEARATPTAIQASRPFCPECREHLKASGAKIVSPNNAVFK